MNQWDDAERRVERAQELFEQRRWAEALEGLQRYTQRGFGELERFLLDLDVA